MKAKLVLTLVSFVAIAPIALVAWTESGGDRVPISTIAASGSRLDNAALQEVVNSPSAVPQGPNDVMQDYEAEMAAITQRFSAKLMAIAEGVQSGQLSGERGQKITAEEYQMAQMQFELLNAWREMLAQDLDRAANAKLDDVAARTHEPRSIDEELNHLTRALELTANQRKQIRPLLVEHHNRIQALLDKTPTLSREALAPQIRAVSDETHHEIEAVLSDHQKQLARAVQKRMHDGQESVPNLAAAESR